jgi:hypothetical protein
MIKKIISCLLLTLSVALCSTFVLYRYTCYAIVPQYSKLVSDIAQTRQQEINKFLSEQEKNALTLSQNTLITEGLTQKKVDEPQQKAINTLLHSHQDKMLFKSILLIDPQGNILYSNTTPAIIDKNIITSQANLSSLNSCYQRAIMALTHDFSYFNFNELFQDNALFITVPILVEKKLVGALAYQLDQEKIYLITNQYINLGKTGEVILATKDGSFALFVAPSRNDPDLSFKKIPLFTEIMPAIQPAVLGQEGTGIAFDHRNKKIIGSWNFIPKLDWGMIVKIDYDEIVKKTYFMKDVLLIILALFILFLLIWMILYTAAIARVMHVINTHRPWNKIPSLLKNPLFILLLIFLGLALRTSFKCWKKKTKAIYKTQKMATELCSKTSDTIDSLLAKVAFIGESINNDLLTHYLVMDDIKTRLTRDILENSSIASIKIVFLPTQDDNSWRSYCITRAPHSLEISYSDDALDTEQKNILENAEWYPQAFKDGSVWYTSVGEHDETKQSKLMQKTIYAQPLIDENKHAYAIIVIDCILDTIINAVQYTSIGQTGYSILLDETGYILFHPTQSIVQQEITFLQYAQSQGNEELAKIAEKIIQGKPLTTSYTSDSEKEIFWIHTQPIKLNHWIVGFIYPQDEIELQADILRHYYFLIAVWITIALLLLCALLCCYDIFSLTHAAMIGSIILLLVLFIAWHTIKTTTIINRETRAIITDQSNLNKFLNDLHDESQRKHEIPPVNIPCGILLSSLSMPDPDHISVSGYAWNKYNTEQKDISREMRLPQAYKATFGSPTISVVNHEETVTWNIQATLVQDHNYEKYPFDQLHIRIILEHKDMEKNTLLTPDLIAYKKINPESLPGLDKEFAFPGFVIEQTFFEYHKVEQTTNYGLQDFGKVTDNYQLVYNVILNRNLLNPFVLYLFPLLVILFSLFSTLLVEGLRSEPLSILGGYTGLFFALIVLQRSLREQYPTGSTLYLEYAFFYTYVTIILLIIHTILLNYYKAWESYQKKSLYLMRILFWPFQLIMWLVTTLVVFY